MGIHLVSMLSPKVVFLSFILVFLCSLCSEFMFLLTDDSPGVGYDALLCGPCERLGLIWPQNGSRRVESRLASVDTRAASTKRSRNKTYIYIYIYM